MEEHSDGSLLDQYVELLTDLPHVLFEVTSEIIVSLIFFPLTLWAWNRTKARIIRKHDEQHHKDDPHSEAS